MHNYVDGEQYKCKTDKMTKLSFRAGQSWTKLFLQINIKTT
uniref:Uncharacterized protein n=1 Tax=Arundo donax TaxID=35708 RepID=A0A0A9DVU6_ARUDO